MSSLYYSVTMSHGRKWGIQYDWIGWRNILSLGVLVNLMAPAIRVYAGGLSIWVGRIPKETVMSGKQLLDNLKEKEK